MLSSSPLGRTDPNTGSHCAWLGRQPQHINNGYMAPPGAPFKLPGLRWVFFFFSLGTTPVPFPGGNVSQGLPHHIELAVIQELSRGSTLIVRVCGYQPSQGRRESLAMLQILPSLVHLQLRNHGGRAAEVAHWVQGSSAGTYFFLRPLK